MKERTLKESVNFKGPGIHTGSNSEITIHPENSGGIKFLRNKKIIKVDLKNVRSAERSIIIAEDGVEVRTVEHLLAALFICGVDHCTVEVKGEEIPALDGSASIFIRRINENGLKETAMDRNFFPIPKELSIEDKGCYACCYPSDNLLVRYVISYKVPSLEFQEHIHKYGEDPIDEISGSRSFGFLEWRDSLLEEGKARGAGKNNTLVYDEDGPLNEQKFSNEPVKHKILDFLGDLSLLRPFPAGRFIIFRGGHSLHIKLLKKIEEEFYEI